MQCDFKYGAPMAPL